MIPDMVSSDELQDHIARKPFQPFRVTLATGETVEIKRRFRAVAMKDQLVIATEDDHLRWINFGSIVRIEPFQLPSQPSH
jgi:hypothetical protein